MQALINGRVATVGWRRVIVRLRHSPLAGLFVRAFISVVLLTAAGMKARQGLGDIKIPNTIIMASWMQHGWFRVTLVLIEIGLSLWLLSGVRAAAARRVVLLCFGCFALYTSYGASRHDESCGCFGAASVNVWWILWLDIFIFCLLLFFRSVGARPALWHIHIHRVGLGGAALTGILCVGAVFAGAEKSQNGASAIESANELDLRQKLVVIEPDGWIGHKFPLTEFLHPGSAVDQGDVAVVLYHVDCQLCQQALPKYQRWVVDEGKGMRVVYINISSNDAMARSSSDSPFASPYATLSTEHEWFATTPCVIRLHDGQVIAVRQGENAMSPGWLAD